MGNSLLNVKVMGEVIGASLPAKLKFAPLAKVNDTLSKVAGDTIVVGKYGYIGEAVIVKPGAEIPISDLSMTSQEVTVSKAGKGIKILDEDVIIRGQEVVSEGKSQLEKSILDKVDSDCLTAYQSTKISVDKSDAVINYNAIVDAKGAFNDEEEELALLFIAPKQKTTILKDPDFIKPTEMGEKRMIKGVIGEWGGCQISVSKKIKVKNGKYENVIVKAGALGIELAKATDIEEDRHAKTKSSEYYASHHFVAYLRDESKCIKLITATEEAVRKLEEEKKAGEQSAPEDNKGTNA